MVSTKEQERKALEQIRKIVSGLGEDSYIGMAFKGCFEIAADNIENDFAISMYDRWKSAEDDADLYRRRDEEHCREIDQLATEISSLQETVFNGNEMIRRLQERLSNNASEKSDLENKIDELELTIIRLKAKLYDYTVKGD